MSVLQMLDKQKHPFAKKYLQDLGKEIIEVPERLRFSGQGDALKVWQLSIYGQWLPYRFRGS